MTDFDILLNPKKVKILGQDILQQGTLANQIWTPRASGVPIKHEVVNELEQVWANFFKEKY